MTHASINGQSIAYEDSGNAGTAVILAHGFLMDRTMFHHQVAALGSEFRIITWDQRGFGETVSDGQAFTYWDSARDCLALLDHLGIERAVIGGMSQGGFLALRAALLAPARVQALVLLDSGSDVDDEGTIAAYQGMVDTWLAAGAVDPLTEIVASIIISDPAESPTWIAKWKAMPKDGLTAPADALLTRDDVTFRLPEITCPTLIVHGTADAAISSARAEKLLAIPAARPITWIDGAGHAACLTHPGPVNEALLDFLRTLPGDRP